MGDMNEVEPAGKEKRPVGRRQGESNSRDQILDVARDLFVAVGYQKATMRAIAARAGVDPALIRHFFKNKETLFATTMADRTVILDRLVGAQARSD